MSRLGIRFDKHTLANLTKNLAPVAGVALGGPAGLALAGGLGAVGELGRGKNIGQALKAGLSNAAVATAGEGVAGHFGFHGVGGLGASAPPPITPSAVPAAAPTVNTGGLALPSTPDLTVASDSPVDPRGFLDKVGDTGRGVLDFAEKHPNAASGALQAVGGLASSGSENRLRNAQAASLEQQAGETQYDADQRKRRAALYAPIFSSLSDSPTAGYANVSANPYLPGA